MSRKSAYKQVLSIGTAVVLGFALFTGSLDGAPKLLSPQSDEQAAALAEKQSESPNRTDDEADLSPGSNREQRAPRTPKMIRTPAMALNPPRPTPLTMPLQTSPPSTRSKTPISTAPAAYISAAFPTTPATPTLPFAPTARTRWARHHSRSTNTSELPKRAALRSSPSSIAWAAPARHSPAWVPNRSVRASAAISRVSIPPGGTSSATTYSGSKPLQPLPPHRLVALRRKRQPQESPHRHTLSQRNGHAAV